jgi:hypothetical protein
MTGDLRYDPRTYFPSPLRITMAVVNFAMQLF